VNSGTENGILIFYSMVAQFRVQTNFESNWNFSGCSHLRCSGQFIQLELLRMTTFHCTIITMALLWPKDGEKGPVSMLTVTVSINI